GQARDAVDQDVAGLGDAERRDVGFVLTLGGVLRIRGVRPRGLGDVRRPRARDPRLAVAGREAGDGRIVGAAQLRDSALDVDALPVALRGAGRAAGLAGAVAPPATLLAGVVLLLRLGRESLRVRARLVTGDGTRGRGEVERDGQAGRRRPDRR